jgi:PAS domain S-box-containing protein/putative nucleotidyltransferase with HDIG domain
MEDSPVNVLLVDNNPENARQIEEMLQDAGGRRFRITRANTLSQGLQYAADNHQNLVLLNLHCTMERKQMEQALEKSKEDFRMLVTNIPAVVFKGYVDGTVDFFDDKVEVLTGYAKEDFDARRVKWTDLMVKADLRNAKKNFIEALKSGQPYVREYRIKDRRGKVIWIQERSHIICAEPRKVDYVQGVFFDITTHKLAEKELSKSVERLKKALNSTVSALATAVETRDPYTAGHQRRVAQLACAISKEMGFSRNRVEGMQVMGHVHDIGKIGVPAEILSKPGKLNEYELSLIRSHSQIGYEILKEINFPWPVAQAVRQHHEKINGTGYPEGLKGSEIIPEARILTVADVVEAMASHRPYRPALGVDQALAEIRQNQGILYDPEAVKACCRVFEDKGFRFE